MMRKSCKPKVINYHSCITNAIVFKRLIILKPLIFMFCKLSLDIVCTTKTLELKSGEIKSNNKSFSPYFFLVQCRHPSKSKFNLSIQISTTSLQPLFRNSRIVLDRIPYRNASTFAIFL